MSSSNQIVDALRPAITDVVKEVVPGEVAKAVKNLKGVPAATAASLTSKPDIASEIALGISWQPHPFAGRWVIVRSGESGVHFGWLVGRLGGDYYLVNARRLWSWEIAAGKKGVALSGVAKYGVNAKNSKIDAEVDTYVHGVIECLPCSDEAVQTIREAA